MGLYRIIDSTRARTRQQINLDQCSARFIINARAASISMEASYDRVMAYQAAATLASLTLVLSPEAEAALRAAMTIEKTLELGIEKYWMEQRLIWNTEVALRCNLKLATWSSGYPPFPYSIINPNLLQAELRPEKFKFSKPKPICLSLKQMNLKSTAELKRRSSHDWTLRWTE